MKPDAIKGHIDNNITKMLERDSYDEVRDKILKTLNSFRERISNVDIEYKNIESIVD